MLQAELESLLERISLFAKGKKAVKATLRRDKVNLDIFWLKDENLQAAFEGIVKELG